MEIVIGRAQPVGPPASQKAVSGEFIEAKMLNLRPPRRRKTGTPPGQTERRNQNSTNDPVGGRVMTLLIPNGFAIPKDIESGNYRIFLRFARQKR
jgi:hypothetical protein